MSEVPSPNSPATAPALEAPVQAAASPIEGAALTEPCAGRLSDDLRRVLVYADNKPIRLGQIIEVLQDRGYAMLILIVCAPFIVPVPTMGLSAPMGVLVMLVGLFMALGLRPWLPRRIADREISNESLTQLVQRSQRLLSRAERILRPRLCFMFWPTLRNLIGVAMLSSGFVLMLPIPLPAANAIPAVSIMLLAAGAAERDGLFVLGGYLIAIGSWVFLYFTSDIVLATIQKIIAMFS